MNRTGRKIKALANEAILEGIRLFERKFPNGTDEEFALFYSCIHNQVASALYEWEQEKFNRYTEEKENF